MAGPECQFTDVDTCHGNGVAVYGGSCRCDEGWDQPDCSVCKPSHYGVHCNPCPGYREGFVCSGHGQCDGQGPIGSPCSCDPGWIGYTCQERCPSVNGNESRFDCSGHGSCYATGATTGSADCRCDVGWGGPACSLSQELRTQNHNALCKPACHNSGVCVSQMPDVGDKYVCMCPSTWRGDDCTIAVTSTFQTSYWC
jgi:hypothetical protein